MRKTKEAAAITRDQLLAGALELFIRQGYSAVNLQQIADYSGVTRGAFYWHFKSKEEILVTICEIETDFIKGLMNTLFENKGQNPLEHLNEILTGIVQNFYENKRYRDFIELTWFKMEHLTDSRINRLKTSANAYFIKTSERIIRDGVREGLFRPDISPEIWAIHCAVVINGIYRLYFISPEYMTQAVAATLVQQMLSALKKLVL